MLVRGVVSHDGRVRKSAASVRNAGADVFVLGTVRTPTEASRDWERADGIAIRVVCAPDLPGDTGAAGETPAKPRRDPADPLDLARHEAAWWPFVQKLHPDVVHVHDVSGFSVARRAAQDGARWIYDAHEPPVKRESHPMAEAIRRQVAAHALRADAVITVGAPLAEVLMEELGLPSPPTVIYNTPPLRAEPAPPPGLRERAGVGDDDPLLVYAGVLTRQRRLDVVLEAMTALATVRLALVVDLEHKLARKLRKRAKQLGVSERVHLMPKVPPESVVHFVAEADVGVHPLGRYAGGDIALPNKLFEYLHAGLPMVVSDSPAMADFVRRHGLGEVAPVGDARAWAQAIERALAGPPYRDRLAEWDRLKEEWSWERQEEALIAVYRGLLGRALASAGERAAASGFTRVS